jgi:hypothetical protein
MNLQNRLLPVNELILVFQVGTPICVSVPSKDRDADVVHSLGRISSMETSNGTPIDSAKNGVVSIKVRALNTIL